MTKLLKYRYALMITLTTIVVSLVVMRKILASIFGGWLLTGTVTWGLLCLTCGQPVNIFFFSWGYFFTTLLLCLLAWKFMRSLRKRPAQTLQSAN